MTEDMVNSPKHYTILKEKFGAEVIDVIEAYYSKNYHLGNAVKYLLRASYKGKMIEDLQKCVWYINRYIDLESSSTSE